MKVVIAGAGSVGRFMADELRASGHTVTLIDQDRVLVQRSATKTDGIEWVTGDACEISTLARAGAETADVIASVTGDDEDNLVISLLAKQEFAVPRVVARVNNPNNHWMFDGMWGVDVAVSTPHLLSSLVQEAVSVGSFVRLLSLEGGKARIAEVTLSPDSPANGRELSELGLPRDSTVVAVLRDQHVIVPRGDTRLRAADEVIVLVTDESEAATRAILTVSA